MFNDAALAAIRQWCFTPATKNGTAVPVIASVEMNFSLPSQPAEAKEREPIRVGTNVQASKILSKVDPEYPQEAKDQRVQGDVMLQVTVSKEGNVSDARVLRGHDLLNAAALNAVKQWKYSPTYLNGDPVPVIATVTISFKLE
jgi:TonB family protein